MGTYKDHENQLATDNFFRKDILEVCCPQIQEIHSDLVVYSTIVDHYHGKSCLNSCSPSRSSWFGTDPSGSRPTDVTLKTDRRTSSAWFETIIVDHDLT